MKKMMKLLKVHLNKVPVQIKNSDDVEKIKDKMTAGKISPVFSTSNHTGGESSSSDHSLEPYSQRQRQN